MKIGANIIDIGQEKGVLPTGLDTNVHVLETMNGTFEIMICVRQFNMAAAMFVGHVGLLSLGVSRTI